MTQTQKLNRVKLALRVSDSSRDAEITDLISAAEQYMFNAGVDDEDLNTPLGINAICMYVRGHFGSVEDGEAQRCERAVGGIIAQMALAGE